LDGSQPSSIVPKRKPIFTASKPPSSTARPAVPAKDELVRRPLGPRPPLEETDPRQQQLPGVENKTPISALNHNTRIFPTKVDTETTRGALSEGFTPEELGQCKATSNAFSITIIRRDPSSGAQWNVGNICGQPIIDETQNQRGKSMPRSKKPYFEMTIHLTTPGYNYFRNSQPTSHVEASAVRANPDLAELQINSISQPGFNRQVRMEGSNFWSRSPGNHKRALSDIPDKHTFTHGRSLSGHSKLDTHLNYEETVPETGNRSKGYTFLSPWGGQCKFIIGGGGRSLRCRHTLPAPIAANNVADFSSSPLAPSTASELRFNLPSSAIFATSSGPSPGKKGITDAKHFNIPKFHHIRNKLSPDKMRPALPPRPHPTSYAALYPSDEDETPPLPPRPLPNPTQAPLGDKKLPPSFLRGSHYTASGIRQNNDEHGGGYDDDYDDDDDDNDGYSDNEPRLDLSIGQENAGGGNRGKRVKLGKLIIYDEGFKMLDLIVAANMGVWWSVWESRKL
jgi:hypothetical protein